MEAKSIKMCQEILHTEQMGYLRLYHASCMVKHLQPEVTLEIQKVYSLQSMQSLTWKFILGLSTRSQNSPECNTDQLYGPGCRSLHLSKISIKVCDDYLISLWSTILIKQLHSLLSFICMQSNAPTNPVTGLDSVWPLQKMAAFWLCWYQPWNDHRGNII